MVRAIVTKHRGILETPTKSRGAELEATFDLTPAAGKALTRPQLARLVERGNNRAIKIIVQKAIRREYSASGLARKSGRLLRDALNLKVRVTLVSRRKIRVLITWEPKTAYFFAHLFGVRIFITPKMRVFLHANDIIHPRATTTQVVIPRRNFLSFRTRTRGSISNQVFRPKISEAITAKVDIKRARELQKRAGRARKAILSKFQARKLGLTQAEQRDLAIAEELIKAAEQIIERTGGFRMRISG